MREEIENQRALSAEEHRRGGGKGEGGLRLVFYLIPLHEIEERITYYGRRWPTEW